MTGSVRSVRPDLAVLCRTRVQVDLVRHELTARNVPSVAARTGGVFMSVAAEEWRRFLLAVEAPERTTLVRLAATTVLIGEPPEAVVGFDDADVLELQSRMRAWQSVLNNHGVPALVADLDRTTDLAARVLSHPDGERFMTESHACRRGDACRLAARTGRFVGRVDRGGDLRGTATGDGGNRGAGVSPAPARDRCRRRPGADHHGAKGLEYPVVFVPFAWDAAPRTPDIPVFHDPNETAGDTPRPRLINVAGKGTVDFDVHQSLAMAEDAAEEGRLLYVALTRAKHHLAVWWIENAQPTAESKITELITRGGRDPADLEEAGSGTIEFSVLDDLAPVERYEPTEPTTTELARAAFDRTLDYEWRRASFSSLSTDHPLTGAAETSERTLRTDEPAVEEGDEEVPAAGADITLPMADLPGGPGSARWSTRSSSTSRSTRPTSSPLFAPSSTSS